MSMSSSSLSLENVVCAICLTGVEPDHNIKTKCNHSFHKDCLHKWLDIKENCPYCRNTLTLYHHELIVQVSVCHQMKIVLSDQTDHLPISKLKYNLDDFSSIVTDHPHYSALNAYRVIKCVNQIDDEIAFDRDSRGYRLLESVLPKRNAKQYWIHIDALSEYLTKFVIIKEYTSRPGLYFMEHVFDRVWSHEVRHQH